MAFADFRNDFAFRRIFTGHADILRGLLNDLLERQGEQTIEHIEYLPSEQLPIVQGAKLSILDVRCKDRAGTTFVVEMQLIHHPGFVNRVVYNACKAYVAQLKVGKWYDTLTDVVAISICDFELWPDKEQDKAKLPRVPMLSRWKMTEHAYPSAGPCPDTPLPTGHDLSAGAPDGAREEAATWAGTRWRWISRRFAVHERGRRRRRDA